MPDPKKLIFVCNTSWGIYKFRLHLIRQLIRAGYQVHVLAPEDRYSEYLKDEQGLVFTSLHFLKATSFSLFSDRKLYYELKKHYQKIGPALIFHYTIKANIYGSFAAGKAGFPCISVVTGLGFTFLNNISMRKLVSAMYRSALKNAREVWLLNKDDRSYFISKGIVPADKTFILPGEGIDTVKFAAKNEFHVKQTLRFLLIGRIIKEKGIAEYAMAAEILKKKGYSIECQVVGFYDYKNPSSIPHKRFVDWVSNGSITYLGGTDEIMPYIEKADCIVLPSYSEGLPFSLLEGASMKKPLIATNTAGCREVVEHGRNGFLCPEKSAAGLAAAMEKFYHLSPVERMRMGEESRRLVVSRFTKEIVQAHYFTKIAAYTGGPLPSTALHPNKISG